MPKAKAPECVALISGGASGIGEATVREFARRGAAVAIIDREREQGERLANQLREGGATVLFFFADVSKEAQVRRAVCRVVDAFGPISVLVSSAGIQRYGTVTDTPEAIWDEVMSVNLKGAFLLAKHVIPIMQAHRYGVVINVGSGQSLGAIQNSAAYVSSKHALLGLTRCIAIDYAADGVRALCVCPGAIDTPMLRQSAESSQNAKRVLKACAKLHLIQRLGRPDEVARVIAFLASEDASFMTGHPVLVDGGALVPIGGAAFLKHGTGIAKPT